MLLFQVQPEKAIAPSVISPSKPKQQSNDGFLVEKQELTGCKIIDKENVARLLPMEKMKEIKAFYSECVLACLSDLKEKGLDGSDIVATWTEVSSFLWSNFTFMETLLLSEAFEKREYHFEFDMPSAGGYIETRCKEDKMKRLELFLSPGEYKELKEKGRLAKAGSGVAYGLELKNGKVQGSVSGHLIDCDTSAMFVAEIFKALQPSYEVNLVDLPFHAILNIRNIFGEVWLDTTLNSKIWDVCLGYYESPEEVSKNYGSFGSLVPFSEYSNSSPIASRLCHDRKCEQAVDLLNEAIGKYPNFRAAYIERAYTFSSMGWFEKDVEKYKMAISDYEKAMAISSEPTDSILIIRVAKAYMNTKDYAGAVMACNRRIEMNGENEYSLVDRAKAYAELGKYSEAFKDYSKAILLAHNKKGFILQRARLRLLARDYLGAVNDFSTAISMREECCDDDAKKFVEANLLLERAGAYLSAGMYQNARLDYERAGELYKKIGHTDLAEKAFAKSYECASKISPN